MGKWKGHLKQLLAQHLMLHVTWATRWTGQTRSPALIQDGKIVRSVKYKVGRFIFLSMDTLFLSTVESFKYGRIIFVKYRFIVVENSNAVAFINVDFFCFNKYFFYHLLQNVMTRHRSMVALQHLRGWVLGPQLSSVVTMDTLL